MSDHKTIAIFAGSAAEQTYFAEIVRLAGGNIGDAGGAALILAAGQAQIPAGVTAPVLRMGAAVSANERTVQVPVKAGVFINQVRNMLDNQGAVPPFMMLGDGELNTRDNLWTREGEASIRLTEKETAILVHLKLADGKAVSREDLLEKVWSYVREVETHTLETHIYRLRQKIEKDPSEPKILLTQGDGYIVV